MDWSSTALQKIPGHPELQHIEGYDDYYYDTFTGLIYSKENGGYLLNLNEPQMFSHQVYKDDRATIIEWVKGEIEEKGILDPPSRSYIYTRYNPVTYCIKVEEINFSSINTIVETIFGTIEYPILPITYLINSPIEFSSSDGGVTGEYIYNDDIKIGKEHLIYPTAEILSVEIEKSMFINYLNEIDATPYSTQIMERSIAKNNEDLLSNYYLHFTSESNSEKIERDRLIRPQLRYGSNAVLDTLTNIDYDPLRDDLLIDTMAFGRKSSRRKRKKGKKVSKHKPKPKLKPKPKHKPKKKKKSVKNKKNKKNYK